MGGVGSNEITRMHTVYSAEEKTADGALQRAHSSQSISVSSNKTWLVADSTISASTLQLKHAHERV